MFWAKRVGAVLLAGAIAAASSAAAAEGRVALVIGNAAYAHAPEAVSARQDAESVAAALEAAGYAVTLGLDLDRAGMRGAVDAFAGALEGAERAVVYLSGHAIRSAGRSYIAPTDGQGASLAAVLFDGVPLELFLRLASRAEAGAVVFVDAAQLSGFTPQRFSEPGLADIAAPEGVLVVSAAPPGRAIRRARGRDSRFARLVIDRFLEPDLPAMEVARTVGGTLWSAGAAAEDFAIVTPPTLAEDAELAREIELAFWQAAERSGRREDYEAYLTAYPKGDFAAIARNRLAQLAEAERNPAEVAEEALGLDRRTRRRIQRALATLGHDPKGVDGIFGPATRRAIASWQGAVRLPVTGYLAAPELDRLFAEADAARAAQRRAEEARARAEAARDDAYWAQTGATGTEDGIQAYLARYPEGRHRAAAEAGLARIAEARRGAEIQREKAYWRRMETAGTAEAYRAYLARYPKGLFSPKAKRRLAAIEEGERREANLRRAKKTETALGLTAPDRVSLENRLLRLGYPVGRPDGRFDRDTRTAIRQFQRDHALPRTGFLDRRSVVLIVQQSRELLAREPSPDKAIEHILRTLEKLDAAK